MRHLEALGIAETLKEEHAKFAHAIDAAVALLDDAEKLFRDEDLTKWSPSVQTAEGDSVFTKTFPDGKYFAAKITADLEATELVEDAWIGVENIPLWNKQIQYSSYVVKLSEYVDIIAYGSSGIAMVSTRDFVVLRVRRPLPGGTTFPDRGWLVAQRSIEVADVPEKKGVVRGNLHITAAHFVPHSDAKKTVVTAFTRLDLGGYLPNFIVNKVIPQIIINETEQNKQHWREIAAK